MQAVVGTKKAKRFMELEGLRGVAAVMVVVYHYLISFYAYAFFSFGTTMASVPNKSFESVIHGNPIMGLVSGSFAVAIFFVLSGFVLSIGFFQTAKENIIRNLAAKRYLRLMVPALVSVLICYILIKLHFSNAFSASQITHSGWLSYQWNFIPNIFDAIYNAVWVIFAQGESQYNNVLWTMMIEFAGSFLVFGSLLLFGKSSLRWVLYIILVVITFNTWFLAFILGMVIADLHASKVLQQKVRKLWIIIGLVAFSVFLGGYPFSGTDGTIYQLLTPVTFVGKLNFIGLYTILGAAILVSVVIGSTQLAKILAKKHISILGKYTFSLYLVHLPILFTFTTLCFTQFIYHMGYNKAVALSLLLSVPVLILATVLFERYVDKPAIQLSSYIANIYLGKMKPNSISKYLPVSLVYVIKKAKYRWLAYRTSDNGTGNNW